MAYEGYLSGASVGSVAKIYPNPMDNATYIDAEVIGFRDKKVIMPLDEMRGVSSNSKIILAKTEATTPVGDWSAESSTARAIQSTAKVLSFLNKAESNFT